MKLPWLDTDTPFPPASMALAEPAGLLAGGADLSLRRLRQAYSNGIFPWFSQGEPILWWSPDPRMVLPTARFAPSHSLRKRLRQVAREEQAVTPAVEVTLNTACEAVIAACAAPRAQQPETWITQPMQQAYLAWHRAGQVHSVETWIDGQLAGGLYGVGLGRMFFGESMFARAPDASKIALAYLVRFLLRHEVALIDCQQQTGHLARLGAQPIARQAFIDHLRHTVGQAPVPWGRGVLDSTGSLHRR